MAVVFVQLIWKDTRTNNISERRYHFQSFCCSFAASNYQSFGKVQSNGIAMQATHKKSTHVKRREQNDILCTM